jgi:5-methylcytosine-specific restriction endonuclease McrA
MSPIRRYCHKHGLLPDQAYCRHCKREKDRQRGWAGRRKIRSGWEWGRIRDQVHRRDRVCVVCGATSNLVVHHRVPLSDGGTNQISNLELRCRAHHHHAAAKHTKPPETPNPFF